MEFLSRALIIMKKLVNTFGMRKKIFFQGLHIGSKNANSSANGLSEKLQDKRQ